ncbi:MAG: DUF4364 family protein [Oscillospiraceae bacterium]|jgi:predicted transcriptional regulator|nr:DUF4364 family protein [Oscillospiraceae bacterium]
MNKIFTSGVDLGGLRKREEIKVLICYILLNKNMVISKDEIIKSLVENNIANYFEVASAFSELLSSEKIKENKKNKDKFLLTKDGELIAKELETILPVTVKEKAVSTAISLMIKAKIENENKIKISKNSDYGYEVVLEISGGNFNLMTIRIYVPDLFQANFIKNNFYKSPEIFYQCFLAVSTRNKNILKEMLEKL